MIRKLYHSILAIFLVLACKSVQAQLPADLDSSLNRILNGYYGDNPVKGITVSVSYKGYPFWTKSKGISKPGVPLKPNMLIGIGSNTKTFIAAALIKLQEEGLLSLDDTIGRWIKNYPNISGKITVRQLLNHTSGLYSYTSNSAFWNEFNTNTKKNWTHPEILKDHVFAPYFKPLEDYAYSNTNYIVAGSIIEEVTGEEWWKYIRTKILNPLGLKHTFIPPFETASDPYPNFWNDINGDDKLDDLGNYGIPGGFLPVMINSAASSAGCIVSSAEDNVKFWRHLLKGDIITSKSLNEEMLEFSSQSKGSYGLGIMKESYFAETQYTHGGTWIGQICSNLSDPKNEIYVSVLSNQDSVQNSYTETVALLLYRTVHRFHKNPASTFDMQQTSLKVYPNPFKNQLIVNGDRASINELMITDVRGREVVKKDGINKSEVNVSTVSWKPGVYIVKAILENGRINTQRVIKE